MKYLLLVLLAGCAAPSKTEGFCLPKRITPMLGAIFLLGFVATFARAEEFIQIPGLICKKEAGQCLIPIEVLDKMIEAHNELVDENRALKKKPLECAKVEVTEPSKNKK